MSYTEIVKKYEPQVGKRFSYDDAIKYWNALDESNKLHKAAHLECSQHNDEKHSSCITRSKILDTVIEHKKKAIHFFNKTINNSVLFSLKDKENFLKNIKSTKLYTDLNEKKIIGGYYEKYMKYKAKYLALKAELEGGDKVADCKGKNWQYLMPITVESTKKLINELEVKLKNHNRITVDDAKVYLSAIEAVFARTRGCESLKLDKATCASDEAKLKPLYKRFIAEMKPTWKTIDTDQKTIAPNLTGYLKDHTW